MIIFQFSKIYNTSPNIYNLHSDLQWTIPLKEAASLLWNFLSKNHKIASSTFKEPRFQLETNMSSNNDVINVLNILASSRKLSQTSFSGIVYSLLLIITMDIKIIVASRVFPYCRE